MLKEKEIEELKDFLEAKKEKILKVGHASVSIYHSYNPEDGGKQDNLYFEEESLGIEIRVLGVNLDNSLEFVSGIVDAINTDARISDEEGLNEFFDNKDIWWHAENNSQHEVEIKNKKYIFTLGDVANDLPDGDWKILEFTHEGLDIEIIFDWLENLSPTLVSNVIFKICQ